MTILIVSRYVPLAHRAGHFTYLLEMMRYLALSGCHLELDVLDPWFAPEDIPQYIREIAEVFIMPASFLQVPQSRNARASRVKTGLRPLYHRIPPALLHPFRKWWYCLRGQAVPGVHPPAAKATKAEIDFITHCLTCRQSEVMIINETFLGNILEICKKEHRMLKTILAFDLHHQRNERLRQAQLPQNYSEWDWHKEAGQLKWADVVVSIQQEDMEILRQMAPHAEIINAPMSAVYQAHVVDEQVEGRCMFIASDIEPNVNGLRWFLEKIWPEVLQTNPSTSLHVCGNVCTKFRQSYHNVQFLGRVDDIVSEYGAAEVCLLPLLAGSGLKIKLVEALSHGRACVATSVGIQGIWELANKAVLVADTPGDFARAVTMVLQNSEKRKTMEEHARRYVIENLSPEKAYQPFVDRMYQHTEQTGKQEK